MDRSAIPRLELGSFARVNYKLPLLEVQHLSPDAPTFSIENRESYPVIDYISPNRRKFYKIFHMTAGTGILTIGLHQYAMGPNEIAFLHPDAIMSWQTTSEMTGGHFCLIHPRFFEPDADHLLQLFRQYPYFTPSRAVVQLTDTQSETIKGHFASMLAEERGDQDDKRQAILLHCQLLMLEVRRAGKNRVDAAVPESYGYVHGFLSLLESVFQVQGPETAIKIKSAAEFADQLHVHPNYLNSLVKNQTGKTVRAHIQERLLYEAKILLRQTDWDINAISYVLGFSGHAAFSSFFHKKEKVPPSIFRERAPVHANL